MYITNNYGCTEGPIVLHKGKKEMGSLRIKVVTSDVEEFAILALNKLVDDEALKNLKLASNNRKVETCVEQGKAIIKSDLTNALLNVMTKVDPFVGLIDDIAQVRRNID